MQAKVYISPPALANNLGATKFTSTILESSSRDFKIGTNLLVEISGSSVFLNGEKLETKFQTSLDNKSLFVVYRKVDQWFVVKLRETGQIETLYEHLKVMVNLLGEEAGEGVRI